MIAPDDQDLNITPQVLLKAYACGIFPMARSASDPSIFWVEPEQRGVLPLDRFHIPRRLARTMRKSPFTITVDEDFDAVLSACAAPRAGRRSTWINTPIRNLYRCLYARGHGHSVEVRHAQHLVGGLYGISLNGCFFGESMFHDAPDASKMALAHLVARLRAGGYRLLDTQFATAHLAQFGVIEISRQRYRALLEEALAATADFYSLTGGLTPAETLQSLSQMS